MPNWKKVIVSGSNAILNTITADGTITANAFSGDGSNLTGMNTNQLTNGAGFTTNTGTVTSIGTGTGLTGGIITSTGTISLSHLGFQNLTDPNDDRIAFWDDSAGAFGWLDAGSNITISGTTISATNTNTTYSAGSLLDLSGTTFNVDLSELTDMTEAWVTSTDEFVVLDSGVQKRKLSSEIFGSNAFNSTTIPTSLGDLSPGNLQDEFTLSNTNVSEFNNDAGYTANLGDITGVTAGTGISGGGASGTVTITNSDRGSSQNIFKNVAVSGQTTIVADSNNDTLTFAAGAGIGITTDATTDTLTITNSITNNNQLTNGAGYITATSTNTLSNKGGNISQWTNDSGYITEETYTGTVSSVGITAGTGLSGGGTITTSGTISLAVDLSELTDMTAAMVGTDEFIVLDGGADRRKAANEIGLSIFSNDSGFLTGLNWSELGGSQSDINLSGFNNDLTLSSFTNDAGFVAGDVFDEDGTFASLRAQGTTKGDVGLGNVTNESKATMFSSPAFTGSPTAPTQTGTDDSTKIATTAFVQDRIDTIIGNAGSTLDTLGELSASLSDDQDALTSLTTTVGTKLAKSSNLSDLTNASTARTNLGLGTAATTNSTAYATAAQGALADSALQSLGSVTGHTDVTSAGSGAIITSEERTKLSGIATGAEVNVQSDWNASSGDALILNKPTIPTNNNQLTNGAGYITGLNWSELGGSQSDINISEFNNDSGFTTNTGTVTSVATGTGLTGGTISSTGTISLATAGAGAGTYGSAANGTKIDTITIDAYGRVTAVATGATGTSSTSGTVTSVATGDGLTGGTITSTGTISLVYEGAGENFIDVATNLEGTSISTGDTIIYHDANDNNIKKGLVSDLPLDNYTKWQLSDGTTQTNVTTGTTVTFSAGSNIAIANSSNTITISATDTNTTYSAGSLLDLSGTTFNVDLSELTDMTTAWVNSTDEFVVLDNGVQKRKLGSEIFGSNAFNSTTIPTSLGDLSPGDLQDEFTLSNTNVSEFNNDAGYTTNTGTVTSVGITTSAGLDGSGTITSAGTVDISLDLSELTDMTGAINTAEDEIILLDNGAQRRKRFSEIFGSNAYNSTTIPTNNNQLTNGAGYTTNLGDITGVTAGTGLTGGGSSGTVTLNVSGLTTSELAGSSLQTSGEVFSDSDTILMTAAAIDDRIDSKTYGSWEFSADGSNYTVNAGANVTLNAGENVSITHDGSGNVDIGATDTDTTYSAGTGLNLNPATTFNVDTNLSTDGVHTIGRDGNDKFVVNATNHAWYLDGVLDMRLANTGQLDVDGNIVAYSTVTNSDRRLKTDISTIESASEKVSKLRGVEYTWDYGKLKGKRDIGLIAQEVEEVIPEVVTDGELLDGTEAKRVDYGKLVGLLIEANKEQQTQIQSLIKEVEELKGRL